MLEIKNKTFKINGKIALDEVTITICYERILNDKKGNPRYAFTFFYDDFNLNNKLHHDYKYKMNKNGYLIISSYNINSTIDTILKDIKVYFEK